MQGKVSMVVPCYNKEKYIGAMLRSVFGQVWDNIELILVNDGSTDGTRDIILEWLPKLEARGYEVVLIDQENGGCCAAVLAGLKRMTGDYFCLVDCDDEIMPEYVSRMAGWLDAHEDYEWAACSFEPAVNIGGTVEIRPKPQLLSPQGLPNLIERYILRHTITMCWIYMTRVSYVKRCGMIENWCPERRATYEPLIAVPLMCGEGSIKFFDEPLYRYNMFASDLFGFSKYAKMKKYFDDYLYLYNWTIRRLDVSEERKALLYGIARIAYEKERQLQMPNLSDKDIYSAEVDRCLLSLLDELFDPPPRISHERLNKTGVWHLFSALEDCILGVYREFTFIKGCGQVIAYGALGAVARKWIPLLKGTPAEPSEYWDMAADGTQKICDKEVLKPHSGSLPDGCVIIVFPRAEGVYESVCEKYPEAVVISSVSEAFSDISLGVLYGEFYGSCRFKP